MEITVEIEAPLWESLLIQAAEEELPVEEIVERAVRDYGKGDEDVARRREERNHG